MVRRDIDPIKIIKILPLSNRPEKPPDRPNAWLVFLKKAYHATREASARMLAAVHCGLARVRPASQSLYDTLVSRTEKIGQSPGPETASQPEAERPGPPSACSVEGSRPLVPRPPNALSTWLMSAQDFARTAWLERRSRLGPIKNTLTAGAVQWGKGMRQAWGTQESWRLKTEQIIRPLTSAVRSLRRRHQRLLDQLNATHAIVQSQQQEITELAFQLASMKRESAAQKKILDDLTKQVHLLQAKVAQSLPATHGTTGQSGPSSQGRRGTTAAKRSGPHEPGAQSTAEH